METVKIDPGNLLACLRRDGFQVRQTCGQLFISPGSRLSPDQRREIDACKVGLVSLLQEEGGAGRPSVFNGILASGPLDPLASLLTDPDLPGLAHWLETTAPPTGPLVLETDRMGRPVLTVADPAAFWVYAQERVAEGLRGQAGRGLLWLLRLLKEVMER